MKADMRVPASGGTEYLLVIEAETDLERGALAHFVRAAPVGSPETAPDATQELRVLFAVPHRDPGNTGARSIAAAFIGWDKRAAAEAPAADEAQTATLEAHGAEERTNG